MSTPRLRLGILIALASLALAASPAFAETEICLDDGFRLAESQCDEECLSECLNKNPCNTVVNPCEPNVWECCERCCDADPCDAESEERFGYAMSFASRSQKRSLAQLSMKPSAAAGSESSTMPASISLATPAFSRSGAASAT